MTRTQVAGGKWYSESWRGELESDGTVVFSHVQLELFILKAKEAD